MNQRLSSDHKTISLEDVREPLPKYELASSPLDDVEGGDDNGGVGKRRGGNGNENKEREKGGGGEEGMKSPRLLMY